MPTPPFPKPLVQSGALTCTEGHRVAICCIKCKPERVVVAVHLHWLHKLKLWIPKCTLLRPGVQALNAELGRGKYKVIELENRSDCSAIQDHLRDLTGARSVPRVFIGGIPPTFMSKLVPRCFSDCIGVPS